MAHQKAYQHLGNFQRDRDTAERVGAARCLRPEGPERSASLTRTPGKTIVRDDLRRATSYTRPRGPRTASCRKVPSAR
jgi:hypothetical protein